jgi:hypothetical protein
MSEAVRAMLAKIQTVEEIIAAFGDERQCRRLPEALVASNALLNLSKSPSTISPCNSIALRPLNVLDEAAFYVSIDAK